MEVVELTAIYAADTDDETESKEEQLQAKEEEEGPNTEPVRVKSSSPEASAKTTDEIAKKDEKNKYVIVDIGVKEDPDGQGEMQEDVKAATASRTTTPGSSSSSELRQRLEIITVD